MRALEEMTATGEAARLDAKRSRRKLVTAIVRWGIPFAATVATLRFLIPSRMDGGATGFSAVAARLGDEHPLALGLGVFIVFSETAKHWWRPSDRGDDAPADRELLGRSFWAALSLVILLALFARTSLVEITRVVGPSMVPTLNPRDRLLVDRVAYGLELPLSTHVLRSRPPRRGDVIVFNHEPASEAGAPADEPRSLVKRVLGLPGDVVAFERGTASINRWTLPVCDAGPFAVTAGTMTVRGRLVVEFLEDRAYLTVRAPADETTFAAFRVPPGQVFVVGDDRALSRDSRAWNRGRGGGVPLDDIAGRVSRLAVGAFRDGRLDLGHILTPLGPTIREPAIQLRRAEENIATCLREAPRSTWPPPPPP
jgi:signal peptidase I